MYNRQRTICLHGNNSFLYIYIYLHKIYEGKADFIILFKVKRFLGNVVNAIDTRKRSSWSRFVDRKINFNFDNNNVIVFKKKPAFCLFNLGNTYFFHNLLKSKRTVYCKCILINIRWSLVLMCISAAGGIGSKVKWLLSWPLLLLLFFTIPNCAKPRWEKFFMLSFILSTVWIAIFSYFMVWMVSLMFHRMMHLLLLLESSSA